MDSNKINCDVVVIGAGVAGLGAASFLSHGAKVIVLEMEDQPGYHSSGRSAALYIEGYENPVVAGLTAASGDYFRASEHSESPLLHDRGGLTLATIPGGSSQAQLEKYLATWQPFCPNLGPVNVQTCMDFCPILKPEALIGGAYDPDYKGIDTHELLQTYQRILKNNKGTLLTAQPVESLSRDGDHWLVTTPGYQVHAQWVVNAAGAWANTIADRAGIPTIDLSPLKRTAAMITAPEGAESWPIMHTLGADLYFKPESSGIMVCPQDETPSEPMDAFADDYDVAVAMDRFAQVVNYDVQHIQHTWAGLRTFAPDRYPVLGEDPRSQGFFWLAGQGGFGVQTSPALGRLTAEVILHGSALDSNISIERLVG